MILKISVCEDKHTLSMMISNANTISLDNLPNPCHTICIPNGETMRQIERDMLSAIKLGKCWRKANTEVYTNDNSASLVYLHGNHIATVTDDNVTVFDGGWRTNTTKSCLNAIINEFCDALTDGVFQKDYEWLIKDNNEVIEFESGYVFN